jgi:hypothetical protein
MIKFEYVFDHEAEYPHRYRPSCTSSQWVEMIAWCKDKNIDCLAGSTWFSFKNRGLAEAFRKRFEGQGPDI